MKFKLGVSWHQCPPAWKNMVYHVRELCNVTGSDVWDDGYEKLDEYLYENFRGRLDSFDETLSYIEFESEAHHNWFILRWA